MTSNYDIKKLEQWLTLAFSYGIGCKKMQEILQRDPLLKQLPYNLKVDRHKVQKILEWREAPNCHVIALYDDNYPVYLRNIVDPPPVLFVKGMVAALNTAQIAIVGARKASAAGIMVAENLARALVTHGLIITSGLAYGIDSAAHSGALAQQGYTVAVLGSGIERIYPASHQQLAQRIIANGALVSEFYLDEAPNSYNFPKRNRIISGLSLGLVVVEAELSSGSLITAKYALDQGREVFAVPGAIYDKRSRGCHYLLKQGAKLVENVDDILEELNIKKSHSNSSHQAQYKKLNEVQKLLLTAIQDGTRSLATLTKVVNLSWAQTCATLTQLEMLGFVVVTTSGYQLSYAKMVEV